MSQIDFSGRVAIVTGAGRGLGRAYALELARRGARVVVNDVATPHHVVDEIVAAGGEAIASWHSVANPEGGISIVQDALNHYGTVDIVISNAGITRDSSFGKLTVEDVESVLSVHLRGGFHVTMPAFQVMKDNRYGRLLYVTSASGLFGNFGQANYAAGKMGLVGLAKTIAIEGARYGIHSNALAPLARTPMTEGVFGERFEHFDPELVVPMALYLVSEECQITHEILSAGGGHFARVVVGETPGWTAPDERPALEDVRDHMDEIATMDGEIVLPADLMEEIEIARTGGISSES